MPIGWTMTNRLLIALISLIALIQVVSIYVITDRIDRQGRELHNLRGVVADQAATIQYLTDPATIQKRTIDMLTGSGEYAK